MGQADVLQTGGGQTSPPALSPAKHSQVQRLRRRDLVTWERLVESQYGRLYNLHLHLVEEPDVAADLTQDTFEQAWKSVHRFRGDSRPEVWLYGVALNVNRNWHHRHSAHDPREEQLRADLPDPNPTAEELALLRERQDMLCGAIRRLPEHLRRTVVLRYFLGVSAVEIAQAENVAPGTVRWRLHQALKKLWVLLQPTLGKELADNESEENGTIRLTP